MRTLRITAADVKDGKYVGKEDVSNFEGHIEIAGGLGWVTFAGYLCASGYISAGAGSGIKAGEGIEAGWGIEAGEGIVSGLWISCKAVLTFRLRLFAGVCWWREITDDEKTITCGVLRGGEVCYGIVKETGLEAATVATSTVTVSVPDLATRIAAVEERLAVVEEEIA